MSEKRKLGRGLADVMDVFCPQKEDSPAPPKETEKKKTGNKKKSKKKESNIKVFLSDKVSIKKKNTYILETSISDILSLNLTPYEDVIYNKMYRLSYGEGKNYCQMGYGKIIECSSLKCTRTAKIAIEGLVKKKYIARIKINEKERKGKGTLYRIFSGEEIISGKTAEGTDIEKIDTTWVEGAKIKEQL